MSLYREREVIGRDTLPIIENTDQRGATALYIDVDMARASIQTVFQQFFDNGGWALDHLARSDLVDERARQESNRHDDLELARSSGRAVGRRSDHRAPRIPRLGKARPIGRMVEEKLLHAIEDRLGEVFSAFRLIE